MSTKLKRISVTILPEWEKELNKLKKEKFYDKPRAELLRFLIEQGLKRAKETKAS